MKLIKFLPILLVIFAGLLASRTLLLQFGYFNMHDDLQMMRQLEMEKCFKDFQIPCRWVPDMGYGYGFPLFNFYPPLPYLVGEVFRLLQFSFIDTVKITFALSFIFSGISMYYLAREFFGKRGGVISSIFYIWAPYHSVDVYVRGAMNEAWALVWFPLILLFSYKKNYVFLALAWAGLLLSHNLMAMIFAPVFSVWCVIFLLQDKKQIIKNILSLVKSGLLALSLSSFFTFPAIFEQKYVHVDTLIQGYYEFIAHYANINQLLISRFWGYGPSTWLQGDGMPFPVGHVHWVLSLVVATLTIAFLWKNRNSKKSAIPIVYYILLFLLAVGWFAVFMAHSRSTFIWQSIKPLAFVQFPWRFLTLVMFSFSLLAGGIVIFIKNKFILAILCLVVVAWNWSFFLPQHGKMGPLTDTEKFNGAAWELQRTAGIFDYLPNTAKENPKDAKNTLVDVVKGDAVIFDGKQGTDWASFTMEGNDSKIRVNMFDFPTWKITANGSEVSHYIPDTEKWGRMYLDVPAGKHAFYIKLQNTPIRTVSNMISLVSWSLLIFGAFLLKLKREHRRTH